MNARSRAGHARWWLRLALASGLTVGAFALHSLPADAAPSGRQTVLAGLTSQGFPSYFRISPNGRTVEAGRDRAEHERARPAPSSCSRTRTSGSRSRAAASCARTSRRPPTPVSGGGTYSGTDSLSAKLNRQRTQLTGTWRLQLTYISPTGQTDQCDSGLVRFTDVR